MSSTLFDKEMKYLFDTDFFSPDFDPEDNNEHREVADSVLKKYEWNEVYKWFFEHLIQECLDAYSVYNALNLYVYYSIDSNPVPNPYDLCGYILYRIDLTENNRSYGEFTDEFVSSVLKDSGMISLDEIPYYNPFDDERMTFSIDKWRKIASSTKGT